ncbi:MAG: metal-dependent hydrolase [bacterium]|nr:metal-dependent hydrolase [bacterium]
MSYLIDVIIHTTIGIIVTVPLWAKPFLRKVLFAVFIVSSLIDIDHFISAKSIHLKDAATLRYRPYTHSITFAVIAGGITFGITKSPRIGVAVCSGIMSHVLRDASTGITFILYPMKLTKIPVWVYVMSELLIFICCLVLRKWI